MEDRYLFKGKRLDNGEWVIGYYGVIGERNVIIEKYAENYYCPDTCESRHGNQIHEVNSKTICQCTGLKDKNGKLIWENDIMVAHLDDEFPEDVTYVRVMWHNNGFYMQQIGSDYYDVIDEFAQNNFEVCGNIFDNPELLEVGE